MGAATQDYDQSERAERRRTCQRGWLRCAGVTAVLLAVLLAAAGVCYLLVEATSDDPDYSIAISSVSGLDPATDLGQRPTLDPQFDITLGVASPKLWARECAEPGMYVEVSYRGVSLASSVTTMDRICAGPRKEVDRRVVARGTGVVVPGSVLDSLAGDLRLGAQVFDVALRWKYHDLSCGPRRVGDASELC